jgi:hypothetical protein
VAEKNRHLCSKFWSLLQKLDYNNCFQEKRHFVAENWRKPHKFVVITSTPRHENNATSATSHRYILRVWWLIRECCGKKPWRRGIVVIASAYRTEDPRFESHRGVKLLGIYTLQWCCNNVHCHFVNLRKNKLFKIFFNVLAKRHSPVHTHPCRFVTYKFRLQFLMTKKLESLSWTKFWSKTLL